MAADLGTKPLAGSRIEELKKICGMSTEIEEQEVKRGEDEGLGGAGVLKKAIKLLVVASLLQTIEGQPDEEERNRERTAEDTTMFYVFIICYTFVVMLAMSVFQRMWRTLGERYHGPREPVSRDEWRQYDRQRRYDEANMVIEEAHQAGGRISQKETRYSDAAGPTTRGTSRERGKIGVERGVYE